MRWAMLCLLALSSCAHTPEPPGFDGYAAYLPRATASRAVFDPARLQGRVVLVTFLATWCFPCLADLATLKKLDQSYGAKGFSNVVVGMDLEGRKVLEPFAAEYELVYPVVVADDRLRSGQTPFGRIRELPTRLLFGRDGQLVLGYTGVTDYASLERYVVDALGR